MNYCDWYDKLKQTSAKSEKGRAWRKAEMDRVLRETGTTISTLRVARFRGRVGRRLGGKLIEATKDSTYKVTTLDDGPKD